MSLFNLFRPKWKHSDSQVRKEAVRKIKDQAILFEIAKSDTDENVCKQAVENINDQEILLEISRPDSS